MPKNPSRRNYTRRHITSQCRRPLIFQTMDYVCKFKISEVFQLGCKDIGIRKFEIVAKTQFVSSIVFELILSYKKNISSKNSLSDRLPKLHNRRTGSSE